MNEYRFDKITRGLTAGTSRRQVFGGLLGGAAVLLTGATVLEAKQNGQGKGKGKGRGKSNGKGRGRPKVQFCHRKRKGEDYTLISVGSPAAKAHRGHGDELCEPETCRVATGCNEDGSCIFEQAAEGTDCELDGVAGTCDAAGACDTETA